MEACSRSPHGPPDINFAYEIFPQPPRVGPVTVTLRIFDYTGAAITGVHVALEATMSHAGMGPVFAEAKETGPGHYQSIVQLSMAGDWFVIVHVTWPDNRKAVYQFEIKGVEP
ncbi:MAG TPA: FixH family protein [Pyrinomonadaceae bacterium]|nr:FixH family protein [Pyrinomonadaceae bacterium]